MQMQEAGQAIGEPSVENPNLLRQRYSRFTSEKAYLDDTETNEAPRIYTMPVGIIPLHPFIYGNTRFQARIEMEKVWPLRDHCICRLIQKI